MKAVIQAEFLQAMGEFLLIAHEYSLQEVDIHFHGAVWAVEKGVSVFATDEVFEVVNGRVL